MKGFKEGLMIVLPWWIGFSIILLSIEYLRADNEINITQSGDGIELYIEQERVMLMMKMLAETQKVGL